MTLPTLIGGAGDQAARRLVEFFTVNIRNKNTRAVYARVAGAFMRWCEARGLADLRDVQPVHVAAYVEALRAALAAPTVKRHLACIRMLFDWLITGQVCVQSRARRPGQRYSVSKGSTPVLSSEEATEPLHGMDISTPIGLRDRAVVAVLTYTFARVGAVVALKVEDYYPQEKRWWLKLREKNGKLNEMPCHHNLEEYLDAYIEAAGIACDRKGPLFRAASRVTKELADGPISRVDVWRMIRRRASDAGIEAAIGCHTFRAIVITDYLRNGGRIEVAQRMAGTRTPELRASMTGATTM